MQTRRATVSFKTVGCRLNQAETAMIRAAFEEAGYKAVPFGIFCDVCVIHGCVVTAKAEEDSLRLARSIKRRYPNAFVVLAGCAAELLKNEARALPEQIVMGVERHGVALLPHPPSTTLRTGLRHYNNPEALRQIDYLAGQNEKFNLPAILAQGGLNIEKQKQRLPPSFNTKRAIVKIQDGCDCQCAYCIVPSVRGPSKSRPADEIIEEISKLTLNGFTEIVLTGANIGCYADGECRLPQLLEKIEAIESLRRFRISSLEISNASPSFPTRSSLRSQELCSGGVGSGIQEIPKQNRDWIPAFRRRSRSYGGQAAGMTDTIRAVIDFMASSKKMCFFLHLPLQSGSAKILKAMGRTYSAQKYCSTVEYAQKKLGLFGLGTDIIVGFPGEAEEDFHATGRIVEQLPFSKLHVFSYSPRPGTLAAAMPEQAAKKDKDKRASELIELGLRKRNEFAAQFVGKRLNFVVEKVRDGWAEGWTGEYLWARVQSENLKLKQIAEFVCARAEDDVLLGKG